MLPELRSGRELSKVDVHSGLTHVALLLQQQIAAANKGIYEAAQARPECAGMGTTIVAAVFHGNRVSIGHIGDSRCYRLRGEKFEQLTHDHSLLQEQIDCGAAHRRAGALLAQQEPRHARAGHRGHRARRHQRVPRRGQRHLPAVLRRPDRHGRPRGRPHGRRRTSAATWPSAAAELVELANQNGGRDNISVIMVQVPPEFLPDAAGRSAAWPRRRATRTAIMGKLVLFLADGTHTGRSR